jgi:Ca2+-binding RTX toxin-like protein
VGGLGNDTLSGGAGNDVYNFSVGDGVDQIHDVSGSDSIGFSFASSGVRRVYQNGTSLVIDYGSTDSVVVNGYFNSDLSIVSPWTIRFSDTTWQHTAVMGTADNDMKVFGPNNTGVSLAGSGAPALDFQVTVIVFLLLVGAPLELICWTLLTGRDPRRQRTSMAWLIMIG